MLDIILFGLLCILGALIYDYSKEKLEQKAKLPFDIK